MDAIKAAGEAKVPFTSGLLIGIGETRMERIEALLQLRDIHGEYGHIEVMCHNSWQHKSLPSSFLSTTARQYYPTWHD